jgi:hypothetical protein
MFVEGEFLDTVIGIPDYWTEIVMLRPPDGATKLELSRFARPDHLPGSPAVPACPCVFSPRPDADNGPTRVDRLARHSRPRLPRLEGR